MTSSLLTPQSAADDKVAEPIRVAALTEGKNVPSARFRIRQMIPTLKMHGVDMREFVPLVTKYPPTRKWLRPAWAAAALAARVPAVVATYRHDMTLLQRELISAHFTLEPLTKRPRVLDVDDAIFLHRGGDFAAKIAQRCDMIICGNDYLREMFSRWNQNIVKLPTAVDVDRFTPTGAIGDPSVLTIGWTGMSSNLKYVYGIEGALQKVMERWPNVVLRIVADRRPTFSRIPNHRVEFVKWSQQTEAGTVQSMTIGIMPLEDTEWERGKCSYKMLQYMACGIPVVVSPVGMNNEIMALGRVGLAARNEAEWVSTLESLLADGNTRKIMGNEGRAVVERHFSIQVVATRLASALRSLV